MQLRDPFKFQRRATSAGDKFGRPAGGAWSDLVARTFAQATPKQGGEVALGGRIEGRQAWELIVRRDPGTEAIRIADRAVDLVSGLTLNVRAVAPYQADPVRFLLVTAESGGADG